MRILGIESSSLVASVAIVTDDLLTAEYTVNLKKTHSQTLLPMLDRITSMLEIDLQTIDAIAVAGGPGSFTGLRIGCATAKGIGQALNKPLIHIKTMDAMAYGLWSSKAQICPIMDARRDQVYTGLYDVSSEFQCLMPQCAMDIYELLTKLNEENDSVIFLGDGVPVYQNVIKEKLNIPYELAPPHLNRQRAASVAALGAIHYQQGKVESASDYSPEYLRKPQAEREREEKQG